VRDVPWHGPPERLSVCGVQLEAVRVGEQDGACAGAVVAAHLQDDRAGLHKSSVSRTSFTMTPGRPPVATVRNSK